MIVNDVSEPTCQDSLQYMFLKSLGIITSLLSTSHQTAVVLEYTPHAALTTSTIIVIIVNEITRDRLGIDHGGGVVVLLREGW